MSKYRFVSDSNVGVLRVGTTDSGDPALASFAGGAYETDNEEHAKALRDAGFAESEDAVQSADLVDVRLPGSQFLVPGAPRAGAGVPVAIPTDGDRTDGGEAAGQIVTGDRTQSLAGLQAAQPDGAEDAPGADAADSSERAPRRRAGAKG